MNRQNYCPFKAKWYKILPLCLFVLFSSILCSCQPGSPGSIPEAVQKPASSTGSRKYGPICIPVAKGTDIIGNDSVTFDVSDKSQGYFFVNYLGDNQKVKLQVTGPDGIKYTYNIDSEPACLNIPSGNGTYDIALFENIANDQYATVYKGSFEVTLDDEFLPFLYPNKNVYFTESSKAVKLAKDITKDSTCDLEAVSAVYHYITTHITYDKEEAKTVAYNYVPDVDEVLTTKKGICYDYASLMAAMLRSLSIPTKLQIGYAGTAYHAWISTYIEDVGWIDNIIQFDGKSWSLMDPTFAANDNSESLKEFIGDGSNYKIMYSY